MKLLKNHDIVSELHYDPKEELFYCGIPMHSLPLIHIGSNADVIEKSFIDVTNDYFEYCCDCYKESGGGYNYRDRIDYDIHEAYLTGYVITREISQEKIIKTPSTVTANLAEMQNMIEQAVSKEELFIALEKIDEFCADAALGKQIARQELIKYLKKTGHKAIRGRLLKIAEVTKKYFD